jgi:hypothetical protein
MVFPPATMISVGGGLFWTVSATTSTGTLAGFMFLIGFGVGLAMQQGFMAVQAE